MAEHRDVIAELVTALELASGALAAVASEGRTIVFTKEWAHLGSLTVGEILDRADKALVNESMLPTPPSSNPIPHGKRDGGGHA